MLLMKSNQKCCSQKCRQKAMRLREAAGAAAAAAATAAAQAAAEAAVAAAAAATARAQEAEARLQEARSIEESPPQRRSKRSVRFLCEPEAMLHNELYHEHHPHARLCTLAGQFEGLELELLQPFLNLMDLQRGEDASLLRHDGQVIRNRDGFRMCGFDNYPKVHGFDDLALSEQIRLQRLGTVGLDSSRSMTHYDGWESWAGSFPPHLLPGVYAADDCSTRWAQDMEAMLLQTLETNLPKLGYTLDPKVRLSHAHVLDQEKLGSSFKWHRDHEEQHRGRQIVWTMVVLLRFDVNGRASSMMIAGASQPSPYKKVGAFHLFDSALYHSTVESPYGGVKVGLFFARPW
jgi:hypothetical protein